MTDAKDKISEMPDVILHQVLCLLNAREMVQTCILSKRWTKLWTSAQSLRFDLADFVQPRGDDVTPAVLRKFTNFVNSFLNLRDQGSDVQTFSLLCPGIRTWSSYVRENYGIFGPPKISKQKEYEASCAETAASASKWILYAVKHKVKILEILFSGEYSFSLPDAFFACDSLEEVKVSFPEEANKVLEPRNVSFPKLRALEFSHAIFSGNSLELLLSHCPVLETLKLRTFTVGDFCSHGVKEMRLFGCASNKTTISAPEVEILELNIDMGMELTLKNASKVNQAVLTGTGSLDSYNCNLLSSISEVEELVIDTKCLLKFLERELCQCPIFVRLNRLTLGDYCMICAFDAICSLLNHCPQLVTLTLLHCEDNCKVDGQHSRPPLGSVQMIIWEELQTVKIEASRWDRCEGVLRSLFLMADPYIDIELTQMRGYPPEYEFT